MPEPRPFIQFDRQRPKLANALMLLIFSPYMIFLTVIVAMSFCGLVWYTIKLIGGR